MRWMGMKGKPGGQKTEKIGFYKHPRGRQQPTCLQYHRTQQVLSSMTSDSRDTFTNSQLTPLLLSANFRCIDTMNAMRRHLLFVSVGGPPSTGNHSCTRHIFLTPILPNIELRCQEYSHESLVIWVAACAVKVTSKLECRCGFP